MKSVTTERKKQAGQAIFEFILLFLVISTISLLIYQGVNGKIAQLWEKVINIILEDPNQKLKIP